MSGFWVVEGCHTERRMFELYLFENGVSAVIVRSELSNVQLRFDVFTSSFSSSSSI